MISPLSCNDLRAARLPRLHYIVERPDWNSTSYWREYEDRVACKASFALQDTTRRARPEMSTAKSANVCKSSPLGRKPGMWEITPEKSATIRQRHWHRHLDVKRPFRRSGQPKLPGSQVGGSVAQRGATCSPISPEPFVSGR